MNSLEQIEQIRRAHKNAKPKPSNPAWCNTHRDLGVALNALESQQARIEELERVYEAAKVYRENSKPNSNWSSRAYLGAELDKALAALQTDKEADEEGNTHD